LPLRSVACGVSRMGSRCIKKSDGTIVVASIRTEMTLISEGAFTRDIEESEQPCSRHGLTSANPMPIKRKPPLTGAPITVGAGIELGQGCPVEPTTPSKSVEKCSPYPVHTLALSIGVLS
jgi:hypothetical protein